VIDVVRPFRMYGPDKTLLEWKPEQVGGREEEDHK
jgi:hypothetical protein